MTSSDPFMDDYSSEDYEDVDDYCFVSEPAPLVTQNTQPIVSEPAALVLQNTQPIVSEPAALVLQNTLPNEEIQHTDGEHLNMDVEWLRSPPGSSDEEYLNIVDWPESGAETDEEHGKIVEWLEPAPVVDEECMNNVEWQESEPEESQTDEQHLNIDLDWLKSPLVIDEEYLNRDLNIDEWQESEPETKESETKTEASDPETEESATETEESETETEESKTETEEEDLNIDDWLESAPHTNEGHLLHVEWLESAPGSSRSSSVWDDEDEDWDGDSEAEEVGFEADDAVEDGLEAVEAEDAVEANPIESESAVVVTTITTTGAATSNNSLAVWGALAGIDSAVPDFVHWHQDDETLLTFMGCSPMMVLEECRIALKTWIENFLSELAHLRIRVGRFLVYALFRRSRCRETTKWA